MSAAEKLDQKSIDAEARLETVARKAFSVSKGNWDDAYKRIVGAIIDDAELLWVLFKPHSANLVRSYMSMVQGKMHRERKQAQPKVVVVKHTRRPPGTVPSSSREGQEAVITVARMSMLDNFMINGQPIGKITSREALAWTGSQTRNIRFVRMLTANIPLDQPISQFRTADEANTMYMQASEMADA